MKRGAEEVRDAVLEIRSPVTGELVEHVSERPAEEVAEIVRGLGSRFSAASASRIARERFERCERLDAVADLLDDRRDRLVEDLVFEHGKPKSEALAELTETAEQVRLCAAFARTGTSAIPAVADTHKRLFVSEEPLGVIGVITPWNFPYYVPVEYLAPALAMGNAVIWKPAESTPLSNRHLYQAFIDAGFSERELRLLEGGPRTGQALVLQDLAALGFTGSSEVGAEIGRASSGYPLLLELGGNGPTVVLDDADIPTAARSIVAGAFFASGQSCSATERVLVHENCVEALSECVVDSARSWVLGDPREPGTTVGPLHLAETAAKMERHVTDAVDRGSEVLQGGARDGSFATGQYWMPTVIGDVPADSEVFLEETFGPIVPLTSVGSDEEAMRLASLGSWGLVSAVFSSDLARAHRIAESLQAGVVVVNDNSNWWEPQVPMGGGPRTRSGIGRLGIERALRFCSSTKVVAVHLDDQ
jgi:succinate-semialdehyde dehydrogenase/glutarate-semialdehyde dehydrogenase